MARPPVNLSRLGQDGATPAPIQPDPVYTSGGLAAPPPPAHGEVPAYSAAAPAPVSTADRVKLLQVKLNEMGANPPLKVDGVLGPKTQAAMAQYHLDVNGNPVAAPAPTPGAPPAPAGPAGPPSGSGLPTGTPAAGSDADVRAKYGAWAWALDIPQVGDALRQAAAEGWPPAQLQAAIEQTNWWRQSSDANRKWQEEQADNPTQAQADVTQKRADIQQIATQLGVTISDDRLAQMATSVLQYGLDATQLQQMIGSEFHYQPGAQQGSVGKAEFDLKSMAGDYFVPLSDQTLAQWEGQIAQGMATPANFQARIRDLAKSAYKAPWIQSDLDAGQTMRQITDPYRQAAASILEVAPESIDFTNPKWQVALTQQDPKTGAPIGMDLATWQRTLKTDPSYGWERTQNAQQQGDDFTLKLLQGMGRMA